MFVGTVFYKRSYSWYKYVSVILLCSGISLFTAYKASKGSDNRPETTNDSGSEPIPIDSDANHIWHLLFGMFLVALNLSLDGYTNNEQDQIFAAHSVTSLEMMKYTNLWQSIYLFAYLIVFWLLYGGDSELSNASLMIYNSWEVRLDIFLFCSCACIGQVLLFSLVKEFGSLLWVTISVTRKLFTVFASVFLFNHSVNMMQWIGISLVFIGLGLEIIMNYISKSDKQKSE